MKYLERELTEELKKWINRREIYAIKGPRQSGKTTLLKIIQDWLIEERRVKPNNIIFLTFEDRENIEKFSQDPKEFINSFIEDEKERYYFLLDEYHYVPDGGQKLKLLYDTFENIKFIVTGSSSLEIVALSKYLVGRVFSFYLFPMNFNEYLIAKDPRISRIYQKRTDTVKNFLLKGKNFKLGKIYSQKIF